MDFKLTFSGVFFIAQESCKVIQQILLDFRKKIFETSLFEHEKIT